MKLPAFGLTRSIGRKFATIMALGLLIGFAVVIALQILSERDRLLDQARRGNAEISQLLAAQMGGGIRFKKAAAIEKVYARLVSAEASEIAAITAFSQSGEAVASYASEALGAQAVTAPPAVAQDVLSDGGMRWLLQDGRQVVVAPVLFGKDDAVVGTLVVVWDFAQVSKSILASALQIALIAGLVGIVNLAALVYAINRLVIRPMVQVSGTMQRLADGDTEIEFEAEERHDEIGQLRQTALVFQENARERARLESEQREQQARAEEEKTEAMTRVADQFESSVLQIIDGVGSAASASCFSLSTDSLACSTFRVYVSVMRAKSASSAAWSVASSLEDIMRSCRSASLVS